MPRAFRAKMTNRQKENIKYKTTLGDYIDSVLEKRPQESVADRDHHLETKKRAISEAPRGRKGGKIIHVTEKDADGNTKSYFIEKV